MTVFDLVLWLILALLGVLGFMRGFVQEALSLLAFAGATIIVGFFHGEAFALVASYIENSQRAVLAAYILLFAVTFFALRLLAGWIGGRVRESALGPIDRVLGLGFGLIKGLIIATLGVLLITLVYQTFYATSTRPEWFTDARSYPLLDASGRALVNYVDERRSPDKSEADQIAK